MSIALHMTARSCVECVGGEPGKWTNIDWGKVKLTPFGYNSKTVLCSQFAFRKSMCPRKGFKVDKTIDLSYKKKKKKI